MASKKTNEQVMTWLRSKMADPDSLDGINAELTYNVLIEQKTKLDKLGAIYHKTQEQLKSTLPTGVKNSSIYQDDDDLWETPRYS